MPRLFWRSTFANSTHSVTLLAGRFGMIAAFGIGNMVQANSVADVMFSEFAVPTLLTGITAAVLTGLVIIGGVRRIAQVAEAVVPVMAVAYVSLALVILTLNWVAIPAAVHLIVTSAFEPAAGVGTGIWVAMRWGFARGIFSNEAGLGSAAIAHAAARCDNPVEQGMVAMLGTFIDTLCVCSMTALVIIVTGAWSGPEQGAALSANAFTLGIGALGAPIVAIALAVFAFTTIIGWSYYGERCAAYLFGARVIVGYRIAWVCALLVGALIKLELVWTIADIFNGMMALPNLVALVLLSPIVFRLTREQAPQVSARR